MSRPRAGPPVFIERKAPEAQDVTRGLLVAGVRHAADRVVLGPWNPSLEFAVDDARDLVIGAMPFCSGADLGPVGYVVHGTTRNTLRVASCPYTGPVPCNAP
jgi:hypothetical protein